MLRSAAPSTLEKSGVVLLLTGFAFSLRQAFASPRSRRGNHPAGSRTDQSGNGRRRSDRFGSLSDHSNRAIDDALLFCSDGIQGDGLSSSYRRGASQLAGRCE